MMAIAVLEKNEAKECVFIGCVTLVDGMDCVDGKRKGKLLLKSFW